jgi:hypothetical protein
MKKRSNMIWNDTGFIRKGSDNYRIYLATQIRMIMSELQKDEKVMTDWNTFEKQWKVIYLGDGKKKPI